MTTYALLIYRTNPPSVPVPELEEKQAPARHRALQTDAAARRELHAVARLEDPGTARTAVLRALGSWNDTSAPESAEAWLLTVATNALERALRCARNEPERRQIEEKISRLARNEEDRRS